MPARCAIYTRKSADEAPDNQFGSIDAQRELCEAYVASQAGEGWLALPARYDDVGFSGGNIRRPALTRLLADIADGELDIVVVYKIDRFSRSLRDFLNLAARLEERGVTFVAVTQSFSTTSSMGRLTLNVLLSFAQFEREITSERLKDWFAGARRRGMWQGPAPYGYDVRQCLLTINAEQAEFVRQIYRRYPVLGSGRIVADEINRLGALNQWRRPFSGWQVLRVLRSRLYLGELPHAGEYLPGIHEAIITPAQWRRAQRELERVERRRRPRREIPVEGPLKELLHDHNGAPMLHLAFPRGATVYRYYVPSRRRYGPGTSPADRYRAAELEASVVEMVDRIGCLPSTDDRPGWLSGVLRRLIERIDLRETHMQIRLRTGAVFDAPVRGRISS